MRLIVVIPAYNEEQTIADVIREIPRTLSGIDEVKVLVYNDGSRDATARVAKEAGADYVYTHSMNKGLAVTFKDALWKALEHGADVIVNTDADNHYDQSRIGELVRPIMEQGADIVIGSRNVRELAEMPFLNKHLNRLGSWLMTSFVGLPRYDVSTGFRAYSREAALRLGVYSVHTYVHTTLLSAQDLHLTMIEVPIPARPVSRKSRLIKSIPDHLWKAGINIVRNIVLFRPLRFFGLLAVVLSSVGLAAILRFVYFFVFSDGKGHVQSLVIGGVLLIIGFNCLMLGMIGSSIGWHRKVSEELLYMMKKNQLK